MTAADAMSCPVDPVDPVIRVVLADDHALVRRGLENLLANEQDIEVVGSVADGPAAVERVADGGVDVVLMDLQMQGGGGAAATRRIVASGSAVQVVVLTSFDDHENIHAALGAGAIGYLLKDVEPEQLVAGVRAAARGESPLHPKVAREVLRGGRPSGPATVPLTQREREVLGLVRAGLTNRQVSRRLGISESTVKAHLGSVYAAIGVADRTQAALWAERHDVH